MVDGRRDEPAFRGLSGGQAKIGKTTDIGSDTFPAQTIKEGRGGAGGRRCADVSDPGQAARGRRRCRARPRGDDRDRGFRRFRTRGRGGRGRLAPRAGRSGRGGLRQRDELGSACCPVPGLRGHVRLRPGAARAHVGLPGGHGFHRRKDFKLRRGGTRGRRVCRTGLLPSCRRGRRGVRHRGQLPRDHQDRPSHPAARRGPACCPGPRRRRRARGRPARGGAAGPLVSGRGSRRATSRRPAVLRLCRLRPHRHARRGGP